MASVNGKGGGGQGTKRPASPSPSSPPRMAPAAVAAVTAAFTTPPQSPQSQAVMPKALGEDGNKTIVEIEPNNVPPRLLLPHLE